MPTFKIWSADREQKFVVKASTIQELMRKGTEKLGYLPTENCRIVDEHDGSVIDDDEVLQDKTDEPILILLRESERWTEVQQSKPSTIRPIPRQRSTLSNSTLSATSKQQLADEMTVREEPQKTRKVTPAVPPKPQRPPVKPPPPAKPASKPNGQFESMNYETPHQMKERFQTLNDMSSACSEAPTHNETHPEFINVFTASCSEDQDPRQAYWIPGKKTFSNQWNLEQPAQALSNIDLDKKKFNPKSVNRVHRLSDIRNMCAEAIESSRVHPEFMNILRVSCAEDEQLRQSLKSCDSLLFWNNASETFTREWDLQTIGQVLCSIEDMEKRGAERLTTKSNLKSVLGEQLMPHSIRQSDFYKIQNIILSPKLNIKDLKGFAAKVLPYILQRVKMRGCGVLQASRVFSLVKGMKLESIAFRKKNRFNLSVVQSAPSQQMPDETDLQCPVSRLDCLTALLNSADPIVASDLLTIMSQFHMALPLVMRSFTDNQLTFMVSVLRGILVKWENVASGRIAEHSLFNHPFRLLVAVRIGQNSVGKSTILNQLLAKENTFSSKSEPGADYGKPASLDGSVEVVWLTQESCKDILWKSALCQYYSREENEIALLANLHGQANDYSDILATLNEFFSCNYIAFVMPNCTESDFNTFLKYAGSEKNVFAIHVDPPRYDALDPAEIQTCHIAADSTIGKIREIVRKALEGCRSVVALDDRLQLRCGRLDQMPRLATCTSDKLIDLVRKSSCVQVKQLLQLQVLRDDQEKAKQFYNANARFKAVLDLFMEILFLPKDELQLAVTHVEKQLSLMSTAESQKARAELCGRKVKFQQAMADPKHSKEGIKRLQKDISDALDQLDTMNLGLEHFTREIAQMYQLTLTSKYNANVLKVPNQIAEIFSSGHAIELLDGDAGDIPILWFNAVCKAVSSIRPNLRVYVVSIVGLQSSGKSTLLNSLFSCRFAVSVGRCSRGLFMRLLFLDDELAREQNFDAILLIDTEGLGSPEKMNVADAERKDRLLATFAMGISNLTIINVLGEYIKELTEILQIAIVTMTRLEKADISPDVLMVQHLLTEKNSDKTLEGQGQFYEAINHAIDLAEKGEVEVGVRNAKCLQALLNRVQNGSLVTQFHPYRDGATANASPSEAYHKDVVDLYKKILENSRTSKRAIEFKKWQSLVETFWQCVVQEDFALRFKNVKEIYEFIERGKKIELVKRAIKAAFSSHSKSVRPRIIVRSRSLAEGCDGDNTREHILSYIEQQMSCIPDNCSNAKCTACHDAVQLQCSLYKEIEESPYELDTKRTMEDYRRCIRQTTTRKLNQILDATIIQYGRSKDFDAIVTNHLQMCLNRKDAGNFSDTQIRSETDSILQKLKEFAHAQCVDTPVRQKIIEELRSTYRQIPDIVKRFNSTRLNFDDIFLLKDENWFNKVYKNIKQVFGDSAQNQNDILCLKSSLRELPDRIMEREKSDTFEDGLVGQVKTDVQEVLQKFCSRNHKLQPEVETNIHVWTQQLFAAKMERLQVEWNRKHSPLSILQENEERYRQTIDARLKYGFSCNAEGKIIAQLIWKEIKANAISAENSERVRAVCGLPWTTNSELVRLKYFKGLADEVRKGRKERALRHFRNPQEEIEKWYTREVDSYHEADFGNMFSKTLESELHSIYQNVSNARNCGEMMSYIERYLLSGEGTFYTPSVYSTEMSSDDFDVLKRTTLESLKDYRNAETSERVDTQFTSPSQDADVKSRLGCTRCCFWCGALCWGQRGHENNADETRKHHSSHQPQGLACISYRDTRHLIGQACHTIPDNWTVWFGQYLSTPNGLPWPKAKANHFSDWKFNSHYINKFDEMMRWFFQELHADIARGSKKSILAATTEELVKCKCSKLGIDNILSRINQEIN